MSNPEFRTDKYGRFIRDGGVAPAEDFVQVPLEEYERLKNVENCWNRTIEKTTARTIYELQMENHKLLIQRTKCDVCPYKQAVQHMVKEVK